MRPFDDIDELHADPDLRAFVDDVRAYASGPPPVVKGDLAAILTGGIGRAAGGPAVARPGSVDGPLRRLGERLQGRRGRLALGASVLSLTVLGTGGVGALPGPAQAAFERTVEVVGIELPKEVRQDDGPPSEPAPVEPEDQDGPGDGREAPRPIGEGQPDRGPEDDPRTPAPTTPSPADERRSATPDGGEAPGEDLSREARERAPGQVPGPASPPRPGPPDTLPGSPPGGVPGAGRDLGAGNQADEDGQMRGNGQAGLGPAVAVPPGRPSEPRRPTP